MLQQTAEHTLTLLLSMQEKKEHLSPARLVNNRVLKQSKAEKANMVLLCNHKHLRGDVGVSVLPKIIHLLLVVGR